MGIMGQGFVVLVIDERNNNEVGLGNTGANTPCGVSSLETANENPCVAVLDGIIGDCQKGSLGPSDRSVPYDTVCQMVGIMEKP